MTNFIFKSANRLIKNSPETLETLTYKIEHLFTIVLKEQRHQRQDLVDVKLMLNKLLIDKHLQMQVDNYFENDKNDVHPEDTRDID